MLTVAVAGATGTQGGAAARALLAAGHRVRALTRHPNSPAADALRGLGAEVRHADFDNRPSLEAALTGADSLFAVTTPFGAGTAGEVRQGKALVDAATDVRLGHLVFTSAAHADRGTGVPHYESKHLVEQHLRAAGVPWTVIAPAALLYSWRAECQRWRPDLTVTVLRGKGALRAPEASELVVVSYESIGDGSVNLAGCTLIVDEAHRTKSYKAKRSQAVAALRASAARTLAAPSPPSMETARPFSTVMRIGSESTPATEAEASTTTTPLALDSIGAMKASTSGQPFFSPGFWARAVMGTAARPVRSTVRSVPPGAVTRAVPALVSRSASRWARSRSLSGAAL